MARGKKKQHRIHAFSTGKLPSFQDDSDHSLIGEPGFSRRVYCNDPECLEAGQYKYCSNYVSTTKYTLATFLPKSLFEQFRRVANLYFLLCALLSFTPLSPYSAVSNVPPLVVVVAATTRKEIIEDWRRKLQDKVLTVYQSKREVLEGTKTTYLFINGSLQELHWYKQAYGSWFLGNYVYEGKFLNGLAFSYFMAFQILTDLSKM